jgi:hypothetical protein
MFAICEFYCIAGLEVKILRRADMVRAKKNPPERVGGKGL